MAGFVLEYTSYLEQKSIYTDNKLHFSTGVDLSKILGSKPKYWGERW